MPMRSMPEKHGPLAPCGLHSDNQTSGGLVEVLMKPSRAHDTNHTPHAIPLSHWRAVFKISNGGRAYGRVTATLD